MSDPDESALFDQERLVPVISTYDADPDAEMLAVPIADITPMFVIRVIALRTCANSAAVGV
jgi:hypothetical protein